MSLNVVGSVYSDTKTYSVDGKKYTRYVFTDTTAATKSIQISGYSPIIYYYLVGGGGAGTNGRGYMLNGRGGAGSTIATGNFKGSATTYNITVGTGGIGSDGGNSTFYTYTSSGGLKGAIIPITQTIEGIVRPNHGNNQGASITDIFGNSYYYGSGGGEGGYKYADNYGGGGISSSGTAGNYDYTVNLVRYVNFGGGHGGGPNGGLGQNIDKGNDGGVGGGGGGGGTGQPGVGSNGGNGGIGGGGGGGGSNNHYGYGSGGNGGFGNTTNYAIIGGGAGGGGGASASGNGGNGSQGFVVLIVQDPTVPPTNVIASQLSYPWKSDVIVNWTASTTSDVTSYIVTSNPPTITNTGIIGTTTNFSFATLGQNSYSFNVIAISSSLGNSVEAISNTINVTCFKEGTKILTDKGYIAVENLRKGNLVQTIRNGFKPITIISKQEIYHTALQERIKEQLYKCSNSEYPELFEDLVITGCHSILIDEFKEGEREKTFNTLKDIYVTEGKYRLPACLDERAKVYDVPGKYYVYHFSLEHEFTYNNYGVYANGLLVECCSEEYIKDFTKMEIIE